MSRKTDLCTLVVTPPSCLFLITPTGDALVAGRRIGRGSRFQAVQAGLFRVQAVQAGLVRFSAVQADRFRVRSWLLVFVPDNLVSSGLRLVLQADTDRKGMGQIIVEL